MKLSLEDLVSEKQPVFVINCTSPAGVPVYRIADPASGRKYPLVIPKTWIPIEVTAEIPGSVLVNSIEFKQALLKGAIELMHPDEAQKILNTEDAKKEYAEIYTSKYSNKGGTQKEIKDTIDAIEDGKAQAALANQDKTEINGAVMGICTRFNSGELDDDKATNELRRIKRDISVEDCNYIIANCQNKPREWALDLRKDL